MTRFVGMHPFALYVGVAPDRRSVWQTGIPIQNMIRFLSRRRRQPGSGFWELNAFCCLQCTLPDATPRSKASKMGRAGPRLNHNEASLWGSLAIAIKEIKSGALPNWFRKHYCEKEEDSESEIDRIIREYEFPGSVRDELLALPLGLHLSILEQPTPPSGADRRALKSLKLHLNKAVDLIMRLERAKMKGFGPELVEVTVPQDGIEILGEDNVGAFGSKSVNEPAPADRISFEEVEGPSKIFRQDIKAFLEHLAATEQPMARAGPEPGSLWWAQRALDRFVRDYAPGLSLAQKTKLSKELFERVREHHGHKSREDNDTPRHRDLVRRAAQANTRKDPSRKIGKKKG